MLPSYHTAGSWEASGLTTLYSAPCADDAITLIEIRANITDGGWNTVAFVEAIWADAKANARLIAASPALFDALLDIKRLAGKSGDEETDPFALLDLIAARTRSAIRLITQERSADDDAT